MGDVVRLLTHLGKGLTSWVISSCRESLTTVSGWIDDVEVTAFDWLRVCPIFYDNHPVAYFDQAALLDPSGFLQPFLESFAFGTRMV